MKPDTGVRRPLGDLADYVNGRAFKESEWSEQGLPIIRIAQLTNPAATPNYYCGEDIDPRHRVNNGDLLFSWSATLAVVKWSGGPAVLNQHIFRVTERPGVDRDFLHHLLVHSIPSLAEQSHGSTMKHIRKSVLDGFMVWVPAMPEQRRIAAILSSIDEAIDVTRAVISQLGKTREALIEELLRAGFGPRTTSRLESKDKAREGDWPLVRLGDVCNLQPGYAFKSADFAPRGIRLLRGSNVGVERIDWQPSKTVFYPESRIAEVSEYQLHANDVVLAMDRPFVSAGFKVARLSHDDSPALLLQRVGRFRDFRGVDPRYVWVVIRSSFVHQHLQVQQKGTDLPHISGSEIEACLIPLPPMGEQQRIADVIDAVDACLQRDLSLLGQLQVLKSALLSMLLSGGLRVTPDEAVA